MSTIRWSPTTAIKLNAAPTSIICGAPGSGKSLANSEYIVTPSIYKDGCLKRISDIKVGDFIYGKDGSTTEVLATYPQGVLPIYKVILEDGRTIRAALNHQFNIHTSTSKYDMSLYNDVEWSTVTLEHIKDNVINKENTYVYIPNNGLIEFNDVCLNIDPYLFGILLSSFYYDTTIDTTTPIYVNITNTDILDRIANTIRFSLKVKYNSNEYANITYKKHKNCKYAFYKDNVSKITLQDILYDDTDTNILHIFNLDYSQRYIPWQYKYNNYYNKIQFLVGFRDGCLDNNTNKLNLYCTNILSKKLHDDLLESLRHIDFVKVYSIDTYKKSNSYGIGIDGIDTVNATTFEDSVTQYKHTAEMLRVVKIEYDCDEECTCFTVSAHDCLYIASKDSVVSHNTFFMLNIAANCLGMSQRIIAIDPKNDFAKLLNISNNVDFIDVNDITPGALNPFTFLDKFDTSTLMTIIEIICGKLDREDIIRITPIVKDFITKFKRDQEYVDMQDVADYLYSRDNEASQKIGMMLKLHEDSKYGPLLFTRKTNTKPLVLSSTSSIILSLHGMSLPDYNKKVEDYNPNERFTSAIVFIITSKILEILSSKNIIPVTVFCDEAHLLFGNKDMAQIIDRLLVIGRSLNIATVLGSQGISHFPEGIAQYVTSKFMFKSSIEEASLFLEKFDTSKLDARNALDVNSIIAGVTNLETGQCFMIDLKNRAGFIKVKSNYDINLLTSNPFAKAKYET